MNKIHLVCVDEVPLFALRTIDEAEKTLDALKKDGHFRPGLLNVRTISMFLCTEHAMEHHTYSVKLAKEFINQEGRYSLDKG